MQKNTSYMKFNKNLLDAELRILTQILFLHISPMWIP